MMEKLQRYDKTFNSDQMWRNPGGRRMYFSERAGIEGWGTGDRRRKESMVWSFWQSPSDLLPFGSQPDQKIRCWQREGGKSDGMSRLWLGYKRLWFPSCYYSLCLFSHVCSDGKSRTLQRGEDGLWPSKWGTEALSLTACEFLDPTKNTGWAQERKMPRLTLRWLGPSPDLDYSQWESLKCRIQLCHSWIPHPQKPSCLKFWGHLLRSRGTYRKSRKKYTHA